MKILFLHGWQSTPGGLKPTFLREHGHKVLNPALPDDDFEAAVRIAQAEFDQHQPDVVVGSSRGGAVAVNIDSGDTPLVLLCPAWKTWGTATTVKPNTTILHSEADETVPIGDSRELLKNSGLPSASLIEVGTEHRLADDESLEAMLKAVERAAEVQAALAEWRYISVTIVNDIPVVRFNDLALAMGNDKSGEVGQELCGLAEQRQWDRLILDFEGKPFNTCSNFNYQLARLRKRLNDKPMLCNLPPLVLSPFREFLSNCDGFHIFPTREDALEAAKS